MAQIDLDGLSEAYEHVRRSITRDMEDAADIDNEAIFDLLHKHQDIVDAGFFVLIFGQLENRVNTLAREKTNESKHKEALRDLPFERRLGIALGNLSTLRAKIKGWYKVRNDVAHGESITSGYDIEAVLNSARSIERLLGVAH